MNKENWPEFPLWWLDESKRNMSGLQDIAAHLHQKTEARGKGSESEQLSALSQQVSVLTDVTQALLQIVAEDHERRSTRVDRTFRWIRETWKKFWFRIEQNMVYRIVAILGTIVGTVSIFWGLIRHFHVFGR